ncbi:alpha-L-fucosidase, partial [uncultured Duncaniella sp.]|uniref:alpha-L-fucosidase n=1 Tax=uncultured Duncaniella sp. TaxID=2768039 RepID=UPI002617BF5A
PSNVALCVNPVESYAKVKAADGKVYYMAEALLDTVLGRLGSEEVKAYEVLERYTGQELEYKEYEPLFACSAAVAEKQRKKGYYVTCDSYVTLTDGTGVVHIAPAFGEDDANVGRKYDLPFGVSIHSSHAWTWYETSQGADKTGPYAGIPYDARVVTKEDGKGKWWEGYDPQELYVQNHSLSGHIWNVWDWPQGTSVPTQKYYDNFFNRTVDMINRYNPDLVYFDDSVLPFWPINDTGLDVVSHYYNRNMRLNGGRLDAVVFGKKLQPEHKKAIVWDVEKGVPPTGQPEAWQTCTCLGNWHYDRSCYVDNWYKSAQTVVHMLIDIVSKNGNMLLSVPIKGDGTIDDKEEKILEDIAAWMDINKEAIFGTRPWAVFGEGPSTENAAPLDGPGFNEGKNVPYTPSDIRFVKKGDIIYAHVLAWPDNNEVIIKSLAPGNGLHTAGIKRVELLGAGKVSHKLSADGLVVKLPRGKRPNDISFVLKIS